VLPEGSPETPVVLVQAGAEGISEPLPELGRAFDVGQQKGDGTRGQRGAAPDESRRGGRPRRRPAAGKRRGSGGLELDLLNQEASGGGGRRLEILAHEPLQLLVPAQR